VGVIAKSNYERFARAVQKPSENLLDIENYQRSYPTTCENIERGKTRSYSITERQYFTDNPVLYVRYNYGGLSGPVSPKFVFTLPISADFPKPRKEITLECESIFIEKTSECSVTPKAYLSDGSQVLQSEQTEIRVRRVDGSSIVLKTKFSESSRFSIGPAQTPAKVTAAFLDGTAETSIIPTMYQYSPSEMYSTAWRSNCKIKSSSIDCELTPNTKVNPGFKKPSDVSLVIDSYKANNKTGTIEKYEIKNVVVNAEKTYLFSIPFDPLIKNLDFYSPSNEDLASTWKNPKYVTPIIAYSKDNTWLQISCPKNISGNSFTCKATLVTGATTKKVLPVQIQARTDGSNWRTDSRVSLSSGKSVKFTITDRSKKSLAVRLAARVGSSSIYSSVNSWTVNQANNNSSAQSNESATYKRFYKLMTDLWNQNSAGMASAIPRFGGRNGYCLSLLTASQNETGVRLSYDEGVDFLKACLDFLISKGR